MFIRTSHHNLAANCIFFVLLFPLLHCEAQTVNNMSNPTVTTKYASRTSFAADSHLIHRALLKEAKYTSLSATGVMIATTGRKGTSVYATIVVCEWSTATSESMNDRLIATVCSGGTDGTKKEHYRQFYVNPGFDQSFIAEFFFPFESSYNTTTPSLHDGPPRPKTKRKVDPEEARAAFEAREKANEARWAASAALSRAVDERIASIKGGEPVTGAANAPTTASPTPRKFAPRSTTAQNLLEAVHAKAKATRSNPVPLPCGVTDRRLPQAPPCKFTIYLFFPGIIEALGLLKTICPFVLA